MRLKLNLQGNKRDCVTEPCRCFEKHFQGTFV